MAAHGRKKRVDRPDQSRLEVGFGQCAAEEGIAHGCERDVRLAAGREDSAGQAEDDVLHVIEARVLELVLDELHVLLLALLLERLLGARAERVGDLARHVFRGILHEDGGLLVRLGHFGLALGEAVQHVVRQDDRFQLNARRVAVLACEHVHLSLIDSQLADVRLEEEDVGALHDRIQDLRRGERVLEPPHDLATPFEPVYLEAPRDVERLRPVATSMFGDLVRAPHKLDTCHVHAHRRPHVDEVLPHDLDALEVAAHLVVHQSKPVSHPKDERATSRSAFVHIHRLEHALGDVHPPGRLEAVV